MSSTLCFALLALCATTLIDTAKLPETFERCSRKDPNLNECLKSAVQKAIKELKPGLPSLHMLPIDPLDITKIEMQEGKGRPVNMKLILSNAKTFGLGDVVIHEVRADLNNRVLEANGLLPHAVIESDYEMDGQFLVLPIKGKGKNLLNFTELTAEIKMKAEEMKKDGENYWNFTTFDVIIKDLEKFEVNFENLFNGDKELGDNTNKVLNENWKTFWEELKPTFEETFGKIFLQISNQLFSRVPVNDIFLE
ncbi:hypothetical protein L9F63_014632 [Diploptera punctata]|uniref:Uncharacterized protein n=1 Tax=Diploptera punctata TaxID=6984 RepID=A0AAD8A9R6_DIPPU|nr:hypothetical protein L9F63_014632 [Diploptera punctata]